MAQKNFYLKHSLVPYKTLNQNQPRERNHENIIQKYRPKVKNAEVRVVSGDAAARRLGGDGLRPKLETGRRVNIFCVLCEIKLDITIAERAESIRASSAGRGGETR